MEHYCPYCGCPVEAEDTIPEGHWSQRWFVACPNLNCKAAPAQFELYESPEMALAEWDEFCEAVEREGHNVSLG